MRAVPLGAHVTKIYEEPAMHPTIGRIVIAQLGLERRSNGANEAPAIITRVWSEADGRWTVNCTLFPDNATPTPATSVFLFETAADAARHVEDNPTAIALHWPERVG